MMKIAIPPTLLLSILSCSNDGATAFNAAIMRPTILSLTPSSTSTQRQQLVALSMAKNVDEVNRREALSKFVAAASATLLGSNVANAAEFSESPVSESSLARGLFDKRWNKDPEPVEASPEESTEKVTAAPAKESKSSSGDFDGNEAGAVGESDEGSQPGGEKFVPKAALPGLNELDPQLVGYVAGVMVVGTVATSLANDGADDGESSAMSMTGSAPPADPYGLTGGRNNFDGGVTPPPPPAAPVAPVVEEQKEKAKPSKWKMSQPTPYGMANPNGNNPFIKNVLDYCEGGKVTDECSESVKGYLDDIAESGAVASSAEVATIVGFLDTLGDDSPSSFTEKKKVGAAFTSYLDALSAGSAPPPASGKAVKTYLDRLNGGGGAAPAKAAAPAVVKGEKGISMANIVKGSTDPTDVSMQKGSVKFEMGMATAQSPQAATAKAAGPKPVVVASISPPPQADQFAQYDTRLTSIEGRVTSLETKVEALPDQVYAKIEALQSQHEAKLSEEVKKIVDAMSAPAAPQLESPKVEALIPPRLEPVAVVEPVSPPPSEPAQPTAPLIPATPLAGEIPDRGGMPKAGGGGPKKGYGFGGGASWKSGTTIQTISIEPVTPPPVESVPEPVVQPEPVAPAVPASPLGSIPNRGGMPRDEFGHGNGPKKSFGIGGGASWKS